VFWSSAWWERSLHETESRRRCTTRASGHGYKRNEQSSTVDLYSLLNDFDRQRLSEKKTNQVSVFIYWITTRHKPQTHLRIENKERHVVSTRPAKSKDPQEE
jgi:hypothetical protein